MTKYGGIIYESINEGDGIRTVIFFSGCNKKCPGCHGGELQDYNYGKVFDEDIQREILDNIDYNGLIKGITLCGGEPFDHSSTLINFVNKFKERFPNKDVWAYSGYYISEIIEDPDKFELLKLCDYLIDGPYIQEERDVSLKFRGSSNQSIINVKKYLESLNHGNK